MAEHNYQHVCENYARRNCMHPKVLVRKSLDANPRGTPPRQPLTNISTISSVCLRISLTNTPPSQLQIPHRQHTITFCTATLTHVAKRAQETTMQLKVKPKTTKLRWAFEKTITSCQAVQNQTCVPSRTHCRLPASNCQCNARLCCRYYSSSIFAL